VGQRWRRPHSPGGSISQSSSSSSSLLRATSVLRHLTLLLFMTLLPSFAEAAISNWQQNIPANLVVQPEDVATVRTFRSKLNETDYFKILMVDGQNALIGARDFVYNISLATLYENKKLQWPAQANAISSCRVRSKTKEACHNYIRVILKVSDGTLLVCGTHAFSPKCRLVP
jgi:hypothetical protein